MNNARSAAQQVAISEALWRVMSRGGPQDLTLRAVAAEAGCTTGLVTSRFPTKRALLLHARQMLHERTSARMDEIIADTPDAATALERVLTAATLEPGFNARIWLGYIAATLSDDELRAFQVRANRHFVEGIQQLVARVQPTWPSESCRDAAVRLVSLDTGLATLAAADPDLYSAEAQRRAYASAVALLVSAPPA